MEVNQHKDTSFSGNELRELEINHCCRELVLSEVFF